ncbi:MAG: 8-amino-7-oxononanoate synthase [Candidatus Omnitrophica bacterium]|nr:8-amino-7-oxononanoate synthase [Candidatus Omnitrophota bacterium]
MGRIEEFLKKREKNNLLRVLKPATFRGEGLRKSKGKEHIDLSSNDYLGFSTHPKLKQVAKEVIEELGVGSSASRLLSGDLDIYHRLEEQIANLKGKEKALIFNSGYQANVGIISAICNRGDIIFSDKLNHASIIDGIALSGAKLFRFRHNDSNHLEQLLKEQRNKFKEALIITESVFSMDGDKPLLKELVSLKKKYNCKLMVDEAHATGIFGRNGAGVVEEEEVTKEIDLIMGTFSKALGSFGGYVACSEVLVSYLINTARSFIYSTALPPSVIAANLASLELVGEEPRRRKDLINNSDYFRERLKDLGLKVKGSSQIVPMIISDNQKVVKISKELEKKGYWVLPIRPPTVPERESRLRFSVTVNHSKEILEKLIKDLCQSQFLNI